MDRWDGTSTVETVHYVYNARNQIVCEDVNIDGDCEAADNDIFYSYDVYGNLLYDGATLYSYDAALRLTQACESTDGSTCKGSTTSHTYNGDGDRIAQTVDSVTTTYVLDVALPLTMVLAETTGSDTISYLHGLGLIAQSDGTTTEYFTKDALGSVRQVTSASGSVLMAQTYDPYGTLYASSGTADSTFGFAGEQTDASGLIYLRARYYNPAQGRFLNMDPSRLEMNPYQYAAGNPIMNTDPSGLICLKLRGTCNNGESGIIPQAQNNIQMSAQIWNSDQTTTAQKAGALAYTAGWTIAGTAALAAGAIAGVGAAAAAAPALSGAALSAGYAYSSATTAVSTAASTSILGTSLTVGQAASTVTTAGAALTLGRSVAGRTSDAWTPSNPGWQRVDNTLAAIGTTYEQDLMIADGIYSGLAFDTALMGLTAPLPKANCASLFDESFSAARNAHPGIYSQSRAPNITMLHDGDLPIDPMIASQRDFLDSLIPDVRNPNADTGDLCQYCSLQDATRPKWDKVPRAIIDFDNNGAPHTVLGVGDRLDEMWILDNSFEGQDMGLNNQMIHIEDYMDFNNFTSEPTFRPLRTILNDLEFWQDPSFPKR